MDEVIETTDLSNKKTSESYFFPRITQRINILNCYMSVYIFLLCISPLPKHAKLGHYSGSGLIQNFCLPLVLIGSE